MAKALTVEQRYCFDTFGYVVLKNVLSSEFVQRLNAAFDANADRFLERTGALKNGATPAYQGGGRLDLGNLFAWEKPHCDPFRELLAHPGLIPTLQEFCGKGYRLDHLPVAFRQPPGGEGFDLHGGTFDRSSGQYLHDLAYDCRAGQMNCNLLAMSVQLTDTNAGDGGYVCIPGSHKANFPVPEKIETLQEHYAEYLHQPVMKAGDVLFFTEACAHGSVPLKAASERRVALYRFAPPTCMYGRGVYDIPKEVRDDMTEAQRAVIEKPYHNR